MFQQPLSMVVNRLVSRSTHSPSQRQLFTVLLQTSTTAIKRCHMTLVKLSLQRTVCSRPETNRRDYCCHSPRSLFYHSTRANGVYTSTGNLVGQGKSYESNDKNRRNTMIFGLAFGGFLGLFGFRDDEDEQGKVPLSVKRELLKAQRGLRDGDYSTAETCYHEALQILGTSEFAQTQAFIEARAVTMDKLANIYLEQRMYRKAEATFKETLRLMITAGMEQEHEAVIEISLKLSKIYTNQKRYEEAGVGFQWCVETAKTRWEANKTDEGHALLGMSYEGQGKYFAIIGETKNALLAYLEAQMVAIDVYGVASLQYAILLSDEAAAHVDLHNPASYNSAEELYRKSLGIIEAVSGTQSIQNQAVINYNLAMVLALKAAADPRVEQHVRKSISLLESLKDDNMLEDLELYYYKLGSILYAQGNTVDARSAYDKARTIATKTGNNALLKHIEAVLDTKQ